jgi:hypothetical protein
MDGFQRKKNYVFLGGYMPFISFFGQKQAILRLGDKVKNERGGEVSR